MAKLPKVIAVVDDDPGVLNATVKLLCAFGCRTEAYPSAEAYLAARGASEATCLILDVDLRTCSGFELARRLVADGCRFPIIFMSGRHDEATRQQAVAAGCVALMPKPFFAGMLIETLFRAGDLEECGNKR